MNCRRIHVAKDDDPRKTENCIRSLADYRIPVVSIYHPNDRFNLVQHWKSGYTLYCDGDFLFLQDPTPLFDSICSKSNDIAVAVVKHRRYDVPPMKKNGERNEWYTRKNWSSLMMINHAHFICLLMNPKRPKPFLHRFGWVPERYLGTIKPKWNVLVGVQRVEEPAALHFTHGYPGETHAIPSEYDHHLDLVRGVRAA